MSEQHFVSRRRSFSHNIPRMSDKYETFIKDICGPEWRTSSSTDIDGALGVAICKAMLDGSSSDLFELSDRLGIDDHTLWSAYDRLAKNGYLKQGRIHNDKSLLKGESLAWCYVAGIAGGATGICS